MKFTDILKMSGMSQTEFAKYFNVPLRSVQNWVAGVRQCPGYLLELMEYKLKKEMAVEIWVREISEKLGIEAPEVLYDTAYFESNTMLAQCSSSNKMFLKSRELNRDTAFAVAHELRHCWQIQKGRLDLENYKTISDLRDYDAYNQQDAEVDANAFAAMVMIIYFDVQPTFDALSDETKEGIFKRMEEIAEEMYR